MESDLSKHWRNLEKQNMKKNLPLIIFIGVGIILFLIFTLAPHKQVTKIIYANGTEEILIGGTDDDIAKLEAQKAKFQADQQAILNKVTTTIASADTLTYLKDQAQITQIDAALAPLYAQKQTEDQTAYREKMVTEIKKADYAGDGSSKDYEKLIRAKPSCLGAYTKAKLDSYSAGGLDGFIQMWLLYKDC